MSVIKVQRATMLMSPSYFMPGHDHAGTLTTNRALLQLICERSVDTQS